MTITQLEIIGFKIIEVMTLDPVTGEPIILTGDNAAGKSSILDALQIALTNKGTDNPIKEGEDKAIISLEMGDGEEESFTVQRTITDKGSYLNVTREDGTKVPQAQKFLTALVGNLTFDPENFARLKGKDQAEALKAAAGINTDEIDTEYKRQFEERTVINRLKSEAEKLYKAAPKPGPIKAKKVDLEALFKEREGIFQILRDYNRVKDDAVNHADEMALTNTRLKAAREVVAELTEKQEKQQSMTTTIAQDLIQVGTKVEESEDRAKEIVDLIEGAEETNKQFADQERIAADHTRLKSAYEHQVVGSRHIEKKIKELVAEKEEMIRDAELPITGLTFDEGGVYYEGIAFKDLNTAKKIRICVMIAIKQNPHLKIIIIKDGALINRANLKLITAIAAEHGHQVWIEKFQEDPSDQGLHITDGHISHVNGTQVA